MFEPKSCTYTYLLGDRESRRGGSDRPGSGDSATRCPVGQGAGLRLLYAGFRRSSWGLRARGRSLSGSRRPGLLGLRAGGGGRWGLESWSCLCPPDLALSPSEYPLPCGPHYRPGCSGPYFPAASLSSPALAGPRLTGTLRMETPSSSGAS